MQAQAALMRPRNIESLRRLADIAEHRDVVCMPHPDARRLRGDHEQVPQH
jgi:hypothetical protein